MKESCKYHVLGLESFVRLPLYIDDIKLVSSTHAHYVEGLSWLAFTYLLILTRARRSLATFVVPTPIKTILQLSSGLITKNLAIILGYDGNNNNNNNNNTTLFIRRHNMSMKSLQGCRTPGSRDECRTAPYGRRPLDQAHNNNVSSIIHNFIACYRCPAGSSLRLSFFGHLARPTPEEDHHRVIAAALRPPADWKRPVGRPKTTWLRTIDDDLQSLNLAVHTAWRKARDSDVWHQVVSSATFHWGVGQ